MKIWHPEIHRLAGGPLTFMTYFDEIAHSRGIEFVSNFYDADVIFGLNNWIPVDTIRKARKMGIKYVHRVNGLFRPILKDIPNWKEMNEKMRPNYEEADIVIFQSKFSRDSYFKILGKCNSNYKIIYNGVDLEKFNPSKRSEDPNKFGMLGKELTYDQVKWRKKIKAVCGRLYSVVELLNYKDPVEAYKNIRVAILPDEQCTCPNQVLECMAMGIPTIVFKGCGSEELVPEIFAVEPRNRIRFLDRFWCKNKKYSIKARWHVKRNFDIKDKVEEYLQVMKQCI